jgi:ubiquinol-cytochrome c reductase cytochrome c1 subunit
MVHTIFVTLSILVLSIMPLGGNANAAGDGEKPPKLHWHFDGVFGTYDEAALQRGFQVYREVCAACHGLDRVYYRDLSALGYNEAEIKAIASSYMVVDGPDDEGEMFERPGRPSDAFVSPYPNRQAAMSVNNGAFPPDMSLLVKARKGGADYIYGILTGYEDAPHDHELLDGQYWNRYMPGHVIAMAPPLSAEQVSYEDGTPGTVSQYSKDVAEFLTWAAEPHLEARKYTGFKVMFFLIAFAGVMFAVKKKVWSDIH